MKYSPLYALLFLSLLFGTAAADSARTWAISSGFLFNSGLYGQSSKTNIAVLPVSFSWRNQHYKIKLDTGLAYVSGPGNIETDVLRADASPSAGPSDIFISINRNLRLTKRVFFDFAQLGAKLKIPITPIDRGLGTGEPDAYLQTGLIKKLSSGFSVLQLKYQWRKQPQSNDNIVLSDRVRIKGAYLHRYNRRALFGLAYQYQLTVPDFISYRHEINTIASYAFTRKFQVGLLAGAGLRKGTPDFTVGFTFKRYF